MPAPTKKTKSRKLGDVDKVSEYKSKYANVYFVENASIPNSSLQALRKGVDGKVLFIKRGMFEKSYPNVKIPGNFFLVFSNADLKEFIESFTYPDYLEESGCSPKDVVIPSGVVRKEKLAEFLPQASMQGTNLVLGEDALVCKEGEIISREKSEILRILGEKLGETHFKILNVMNTSEL